MELVPTKTTNIDSYPSPLAEHRRSLPSHERFRSPSGCQQRCLGLPFARLIDRIGMIPTEPASLVMERKMLFGIKERAERLAASRSAPNPAYAASAA